MFHLRTVTAGRDEMLSSTLELAPTNEQGQKVCSLFLEFLGSHPTDFREKIPFLKRGELTLDWAAAHGGTALATFLDGGEPLAVCLLATGVDREADGQILSHLREQFPAPGIAAAVSAVERPLMIQIRFPVSPEWMPAVDLLAASLASVYFRTVLALHASLHDRASGAIS